MHTKRNVKIIIFSVFAIALIIAGYLMFKNLNTSKKIYTTNIQEYIPKSAIFVVKLNQSKDQSPFFSTEFQKIIQTIDVTSNNSTYLVYLADNQNPALMQKIDIEQEKKLHHFLNNVLFPDFSSKKMQYNGVTIYSYTTNNNQFLSCIFFNGIFACCYNIKTLEEIIDNNSANSFFADKEIKELERMALSSSPSNIFIRNKNFSGVYNLSDKQDTIEGFILPQTYIDTAFCSLSTTDGYMQPDANIIPDSATYIELQNNTSIISDSLACEFSALSYKFKNLANDSPVYAILFHKSRFRVFEAMDKLEKDLTGNSLTLHGSILKTKYNLYTGSSSFDTFFFKQNTRTYFSFKDRYLIFSTSKTALYNYITTPKGQFDNKLIDRNTSLFSDKNTKLWAYIKEISPSETINLFPSHLFYKLDTKQCMKITCYQEDEYIKVNINVNKIN